MGDSPDDLNMESVIRGWIGEAKVDDQRRVGELTAQVRRLEQARGAAAGAAGPQPTTNILDTSLGKPPPDGKSGTSSSERSSCASVIDTLAWLQQWRSCIRTDGHCALGPRTDSGLKTLVSDSGDADGRCGTPHCASSARLQRSRSTAADVPKVQSFDAGKMLAKLNEVLLVDLGAVEITYRTTFFLWEKQIQEFEIMSRETLPDIVKRAITIERSRSAIRTHWLVNAQTLTQNDGACSH